MRGGSLSDVTTNVREAVIVQIAERRAALIPRPQKILSHLRGYVLEPFAAQVLEHGIVLPSGGVDVLDVAVRGVQILPAVVIIVDEARAPAGKRRAEPPQSGFERDILEDVAAVAEQSPDLPIRLL
jgi:hypothetical protein